MNSIYMVHMVGGEGHEHISTVKWRNVAQRTGGELTRAEAVMHIDAGTVFYSDNGLNNIAKVEVVRANPPYIRTYADGKWTDNLLALPRY